MFNLSRLVSRKLQATGLALATAGATTAAVAQTAPVLIPYTSSVVAGNPLSTLGGYSGDGGKAVGTSLNGILAVAVDPEGNVYIADTANAVIREVNAQSGTIKIIAGLPPSGCTLTTCKAQTGYADGVLATSAGIGSSVEGLAVDGYGNVFFGDYSTNVLRVIYKGGTQVANLIALEDPTAAASASAVVPGYIYTIGGQYNVKSPVTDKVLATKATMHDPAVVELDAAGNIYVLDFGNGVVRVINAQSTAQTFFGVTLQPGYIGAIVNCSSTALTVACPSPAVYTGVPAGGANYTGLVTQGMGVDLWGNVYEVNTKGASAIYGSAAYSGNGPLGKLLTLVTGNAPVAGDIYNVINGNPATATVPAIPLVSPFPTAGLANQYNNWVLRATAIVADPRGNLYYMDNHFPWILRVDVNSQVVTRMNAFTVPTSGTASTPVSCSASPAFPVLTGFAGTTTDAYGDGCASVEAAISGAGAMATDGAGNLYIADKGESLIRKFSVNTQFPSTTVGSTVTQMIQVHFDQSNLPITTTATTSSPISIQSGSTDFTISTAPTCASNTTSTPSNTPADASIDCVIPVTFNPAQPGLRQASLQATTASGTVYTFPLTGIGAGPALALDGGGQTVVAITGLGTPAGIAIDGVGNEYIADTTANQVLMQPVTCSPQPCAATALGTGFSAPSAVAVDSAGNVYVADTGNNRVVMLAGGTHAQTVIGSGFNAPQGVAVDRNQNVYVADTGNGRVVEIPSSPALAQAVLFQFSSASPILSTPVAIAVDSAGNVYVSDTGQKQIYEIPPGGGDLQTVVTSALQLVSKDSSVSSPGGLAVDGAGNVYVSDDKNNVVVEIPSSSGPGSSPFNLSFTGLSAPGGIAIDPSGNVYVADTGNKRLLMMNRTSSSVNFGQLGVFQPALTAPLTLSNIGNVAVTLNSPVYSVSGNATDFPLVDGCSGVLLYSGLTCTVTSSFLPAAAGSYTDTLNFQGGVTATLMGSGVAPLANVVTGFLVAPVAGVSTASLLATVTQPHGINTPTGNVTFACTINENNTSRGGSAFSSTVQLKAGSGGAATAELDLTGLLPARRYSCVATYNGDPGDTANAASPFTFTVPGGIMLSVVSSSYTMVYGGTVPTITGTVAGILPADAAAITYTFVTTASSTAAVGTYPITLLLSGGNYLNYVVPPALTSTGANAVVTITPAPLTVKANSFTVTYGSQNITLTSVITGLVNGDQVGVSISPSTTSTLDVKTYALVPTVTGTKASNYNITLVNGTLVVTPAPTTVTIAENATSVLPTNLASESITITVGSGVTNNVFPPNTVTLIDTFTPFSTGLANAPVNIGPLQLTNGSTVYTPTSTTLGTHAYTATYNGSLDFQTSAITTPTSLVVDHPDFFVTAPTTPIVVIPGTIPGGNAAVTGESAANPETATVTLSPILGYTGTLTVTCSSPSSYVQCALSPSTVTLSSATAQTTTISVQTPATLPTNYSGAVRPAHEPDYRFAFVPLGLLVLLPLARRRKLTRIAWMLLMCVVFSLGLSGCNITNLVKFYTPVPEGEQPVTITATDGTITQTFTMTISIQ